MIEIMTLIMQKKKKEPEGNRKRGKDQCNMTTMKKIIRALLLTARGVWRSPRGGQWLARVSQHSADWVSVKSLEALNASHSTLIDHLMTSLLRVFTSLKCIKLEHRASPLKKHKKNNYRNVVSKSIIMKGNKVRGENIALHRFK